MVKRLAIFAPTAIAALLLVAILVTQGLDHGLGEADPASGRYGVGWSVSPLARGVAIACLVASLIGGLVPTQSDVRAHAAAAFAIFAVTALGQSRATFAPGVVYRVGCVAFGLVLIASFRARHRWARAEAARRPVATSGRGGRVLLLVVAWAALTSLLVLSLPRASAAVERRIGSYFGGYEPDLDQVGFSSSLRLGSTHGMLLSDKVVMRIDGEQVDYLRGAVLDSYDARRHLWVSSMDDSRVVMGAKASAERTTTRITMARAAPVTRGIESRWFLPAGACDLRSESGTVAVDTSGVAHPDPPNLANEIAFRSGVACKGAGGDGVGVERSARVPAPPTKIDLGIGDRCVARQDRCSKLRSQLEPIALAWTQGLTTDREKLDAIARELGRFGYSLDVQRKRDVDPLIDLLTIHREGHCELFASAMALLARTSGIPTRLVSGYRVSEVNPITGIAVVRERNAHTWVEAWVDGRWESWDPTPAVEIAARTRSSSWEHASEVVAWLWDRFVTLFWRIGLTRLGFGGAAIAGVLLVVRRLMQRGPKGDGLARAADARPLPAFEALASALEAAGWVRTASEPLERFARRVDDGDEPWAEDVADALARYAEHRYGGIGEEHTIASRLDELARKIRPLT